MHPAFVLLGLQLNALGRPKPFHVLGGPILFRDLINTYGETTLMRMHKQMRMYKPSVC